MSSLRNEFALVFGWRLALFEHERQVRFPSADFWASEVDRAVSGKSSDVWSALESLRPPLMTPQRFSGLDRDALQLALVWETSFERIVNLALDHLAKNNSNDCLSIFVVDGATPQVLATAIESLLEELRGTPPTKKRMYLAAAIARLVRSGAVQSAVLHECSGLNPESRDRWRDVVSALVSLPNKVANILEKQTPDEFFPKLFSHLMFFEVAQCIAFLVEAANFDCRPVSLLLSRLLVDFRSQELDSGMAYLVKVVVCWSSENQRVRQVVHRVLGYLEGPAVTSIAAPLLCACSEFQVHPSLVLGESALTSPDWKHELCSRLLLLQYGGMLNLSMLRMLTRYLASTVQGVESLPSLAEKLLSVWGDRTALNHTPFEQHLYTTHCVVLVVRALVASGVGNRRALLMQLFQGVPIHLESPLPQIRALGMITAEVLAGLLDESAAGKLEFPYEGFSKDCQDIVDEIRCLDVPLMKTEELSPPSGDDLMDEWFTKHVSDKKTAVDAKPLEIKTVTVTDKIVECHDSDSEDDLDSDDEDLEPYDMSCDVPLIENKRPAYIRDALEGLSEVEDRDKWTMSLVALSELVEKQLPGEDASLAVEFLDLLISLEQRFPVNDFENVCRTSAVAVVCAHPAVCAERLASRFHSDRGSYSLAQRFFMLDVLAGAAAMLSEVNPTQNSTSPRESADAHEPEKLMSLEDVLESEVIEEFSDLLNRHVSSSEPAFWRDVVDQRIESKTRRFASSSKQVESRASRFSGVAASFFFPLIRGLSKGCGAVVLTLECVDHVDDDFALVARFLQVLALVMRCAKNAPVAPAMAAELLDLAWTVRFNKEASVRLAVVSCILSILVAVPKSRLISDLMPSLVEARQWLLGAACGSNRQQDPDPNVRTLSAQTGSLLDKLLYQ